MTLKTRPEINPLTSLLTWGPFVKYLSSLNVLVNTRLYVLYNSGIRVMVIVGTSIRLKELLNLREQL